MQRLLIVFLATFFGSIIGSDDMNTFMFEHKEVLSLKQVSDISVLLIIDLTKITTSEDQLTLEKLRHSKKTFGSNNEYIIDCIVLGQKKIYRYKDNCHFTITSEMIEGKLTITFFDAKTETIFRREHYARQKS